MFFNDLRPTPPVDIADALEVWARGRGMHLSLVWVHVLGCWAAEFTMENGAKDSVPLHQWDAERGEYTPMRLEDYGASGLVNLLERMDTRSGRGLYDSFTAAVEANRLHNERIAQAADAAADEVARETADRARSAMKIPFFRVGIDLQDRS